MPTYQYACTACGEQLEAVQSFSDASLTTCPACGGTLRKVFSAVGVVFKGSGFYKTDSRASTTAAEAPGKGEKKADAPAASGGGDKGGNGKSESGSAVPAKPAATTGSSSSSSGGGSSSTSGSKAAGSTS